jgi:hypothetical protein
VSYSPPYALAQVSVNSAGPTSGAGVVIPPSATIAFTGVNTTGWATSLWEIYDYPSGWSTPAGWTLIAATGVIQYNGTSITPNPPSFTAPAISLWGKWGLRLTVNNATDPTGAVNFPRMIDTSLALSMLSPNGLHDGMAGEQNQFASALPNEQWVQDYKANLRTLDTFIVGPLAASVTGTGLWYSASGVLNAASVTLTGDVSEGALSGSNVPLTVTGLRGSALPSLTAGVLQYTGSAWALSTIAASSITHGTADQLLDTNHAGTTSEWFTVGGDLTYASHLFTVAQINGATVPAAGALTTGNVLQVSGASALTYAAVNLAGGAGYITGNLPIANLAPGAANTVLITNGTPVTQWVTQLGVGYIANGTADQLFDTNHAGTASEWFTLGGDGTFASHNLTVVALQGRAVANSAPSSGQALVGSSGTWAPGAINLSGGSSIVTGTLPIANEGSPSGTGVALTSGGAWVSAAGTVNLASSTYVSGTLGLANGGTGLNTASGLTVGNQLIVQSGTTVGWAALNLAGGAGYVTGLLPVGNIAPGAAATFFVTNAGATAGAWVAMSQDAVTTAAGAITVTHAQAGRFTFDAGGQYLNFASTTTNATATLRSDGSSFTYVNTPTGGALAFVINNATYAQYTQAANTYWGSSTAAGAFEYLDVAAAAIFHFGVSATSAAIQYDSISTQTQGFNLTLQPQQSTQATNNGGGHLIAALQTPAGTGTEAFFQVTRANVVRAALGTSLGAPSTQSALYLLAGTAASTTNQTLISDGSSFTYVNTVGALAGTINDGTFIFYATSSGFQFFTSSTAFGGGVGVIGIANAGTPVTGTIAGAPTGGGVLYAQNGAGKWYGSSGTVTTFGPADLFEHTEDKHCPRCHGDFGHKWTSERLGTLIVCMWCLAEELGDRDYIVREAA